MPHYVIDTNVPIAANNRDSKIAIDCQIAAIKTLERAIASGVIFLDSAGEIQDEYRRYLSPRGQPGTGDRFFLEIINSHPDRIKRVDVKRRQDGEFEDLSAEIVSSSFDRSDRKFAAVAKKSRSTIHVATDSDWLHHRDAIERNGTKISFVCGCDATKWMSDN